MLHPSKEKYDKHRESIRSRDITLSTKIHPYNQYDFFSSSHEWIWELEHIEDWTPKNWCLQLCWNLESPLDNRRSDQPILKEINPECSLEGLLLKLLYFGHLMRRANSLEKTLILGKIEGKKRRGQQRMRWLGSITDSKDMNLRKLQEIAKDRVAWHATVYGVAKSQTWLSNWTTTTAVLSAWLIYVLFGLLYHCKVFVSKWKDL